ncbi:MAG: 6-carboxytetrahydropterin synthase [Candidatus Thiodiazotropha sp.]
MEEKIDARTLLRDFIDEKHRQAQQLRKCGMTRAEIGDHVKKWINQNLDHNMLLHCDDPVLPLLQEAGESVYVMSTNPTVENIARLIFDYVEAGGYPVVEVSLHETDNALASYRKP